MSRIREQEKDVLDPEVEDRVLLVSMASSEKQMSSRKLPEFHTWSIHELNERQNNDPEVSADKNIVSQTENIELHKKDRKILMKRYPDKQMLLRRTYFIGDDVINVAVKLGVQ